MRPTRLAVLGGGMLQHCSRRCSRARGAVLPPGGALVPRCRPEGAGGRCRALLALRGSRSGLCRRPHKGSFQRPARRSAATRTIHHSAAGPGGVAGGGANRPCATLDPRKREPLRRALEEGLAQAKGDRQRGGFLSRLGRGCAVRAAPGRRAPPGRERRKAALRSRGPAAARPAVLASPRRPAHPPTLHTSRPARISLAETIPVGAADWCLSLQLVCMRPCGAPGGAAAEKLTRSRRKCPAERLARSPPRAHLGASRAARSAAPPSAANGRSGTEDGRAQPARGMEVAGPRRSRRAEGAPARCAAARPAAPGR